MQRFKLFQMLFLSLFVIGFTAGCDDDDDDNNDSGGMVATVNGESYTFDMTGSRLDGATMVLFGTNINVSESTTRTISITIPNAAAGDYQVSALGAGSVVIFSEGATGSIPGSWVGGSGTITINEVSASGAEGTFFFTGENPQTATTKVISNGSFDFDF